MTEGRSPKAADAMREALAGKAGRSFWRSLENLSRTDLFGQFIEEEFPTLSRRMPAIDRRSLLKLMGASLALAGLSACKGEEDETALPYVNAPADVTVGVAKWYATAVTLAGYAQPVLGRTFTGRPVKLEGNPDHPVSNGATDAFTQAALLGLYDPGRSQLPLHLGKPADWNAFDSEMAASAAALDKVQGEGFRLLTGPMSSPTLLRQISAMMQRWPKARWHICDPVSNDLQLAASMDVFGQPLQPHPAFDRAETILSLDDDFLGPGPRQTLNARLFADRRRLRQDRRGQSRLFVAEAILSSTGSVADRRLTASVNAMEHLLRAIGSLLGMDTTASEALSDGERRWCDDAAAALDGSRGRSLILVGTHYPAEVQAIGLILNERLGNLGATLRFSDPVLAVPPDGAQSLLALASDIKTGRVSTLAIVGANPAYTAPADLDFPNLLQTVEFRMHAGLHVDETAALCHWHLPLQHDLESWSDARACNGAVSLIQPLVRPFYDVRSLHVIMENLAGHAAIDRDLVRQTWRANWGPDFERRWTDSLNRGFVDGSDLPLTAPAVANRYISPPAPHQEGGLTLVIRPDAGVWDGTLSDNAWAQETPRPLTKITWGNVIHVSNRLAGQLRLKNGDEVRLIVAGGSVAGAVWIMPGQEANTVAVTLGYGRRMKGSLSEGLGYDAYALRHSDDLWHRFGAALEATGDTVAMATTQLHQAIDGFDFIRTADVAELDLNSKAAQKIEPPSLYPDRPKSDPSWGMSIDLDLCIGCNACVTACQAENNIPVVGKDLVAEGREMHWLRIDHYYEGPVEEPKSYFQPVPCMHCEQAPCEMGCPVNAAVHSIDGLNLQIYNRCIGTRTCSSYCPYKVRRFNWFDFTQNDPEPVRAMRNPDVTVRSRGVMEKCTYCVQRIAEARITADKEGRPIRDGEIVTACQQACPTQAIVFGNIADKQSAVSRRKAGSRDYALLEDANTRPRTTYLARIEDKNLTGKGAAG
ncbi:TAT-variant-translocated molybdopterin oxidoreductase [Rhizobium sp. 2YAF20]|uniref:TAT-variant-translocated molybdopterin oxidoreductase n=1 Tax=Rhizobium sp. 2YAF20 TaxID=3233027 RepID=UPI003F98A269